MLFTPTHLNMVSRAVFATVWLSGSVSAVASYFLAVPRQTKEERQGDRETAALLAGLSLGLPALGWFKLASEGFDRAVKGMTHALYCADKYRGIEQDE